MKDWADQISDEVELSCEGHWPDDVKRIASALRAAVAAEREACAIVIDKLRGKLTNLGRDAALLEAINAIRARGTE